MTQGLQNKAGMCGVARFRKESPWDCHHPCQPPFPNDTSPSFAGNLKRLPKLCQFTTLGFFPRPTKLKEIAENAQQRKLWS